MDTKENKKIYVILAIFVISVLIILVINATKNSSYAKEVNTENKDLKISKAKEIDIYEIINKNAMSSEKEEIETKEEVLEFLTKYKINKDLPKGTIQVIQEGREGTQQIFVKKIYKEGELIEEKQLQAKVTKASIDKIVEIGGANYTNNYKLKVGENVYVTADRTAVMLEPNIGSQKVTTLHRNDELKVLEITDDWYKISKLSTIGWVKKESTAYKNPNVEDESKSNGADRQKLLGTLNFNMALNKPSGLSLEQFKKVLTDDKDKNKVFENNAEYFYYIEKQYNINGIFVAAIGIHESAWGTSKIARDKNNLFGYGAYDSNPYNGAYSFSSISESVDLMARVLTKYYLNPAGTEIYDGEKAKATYYNGSTLSGVNTRYATDKNWANGVYGHMKYLYEKI